MLCSAKPRIRRLLIFLNSHLCTKTVLKHVHQVAWFFFFTVIPNMWVSPLINSLNWVLTRETPGRTILKSTITVHNINSKKMRQSLKLGFSPAYTRLSVRWSSQQVKNDRLINSCMLLWKEKYSFLIILKLREHCSPKYQNKKSNEPEQRK